MRPPCRELSKLPRSIYRIQLRPVGLARRKDLGGATKLRTSSPSFPMASIRAEEAEQHDAVNPPTPLAAHAIVARAQRLQPLTLELRQGIRDLVTF